MNGPLPVPGPMSVGELVDRSFRLYQLNFRAYMLTAASFLAPYALVSAFATGQSLVNIFGIMRQVMSSTGDVNEDAALNAMGGMFQSMGITWLLSIVGLVIIAFTSLAIMHQTVRYLKSEPVTLGVVVRGARRSFWPYVGMNILQYLAIIGLMLGLGIVLFIIVMVFTLIVGDGGGSGSGMLETIGILFFTFCLMPLAMVAVAVPLVLLITRWMVAAPGIVERQWGSREALGESWRLTKGNAWRCFGFGLLLYILAVVVVQSPVMIMQMVLAFTLSTELFAINIAVGALLQTLLLMLWQPLSAIAIVFLYFDLLARQEGWDIDQRLARLEAEVAPLRESAAPFPASGAGGDFS